MRVTNLITLSRERHSHTTRARSLPKQCLLESRFAGNTLAELCPDIESDIERSCLIFGVNILDVVPWCLPRLLFYSCNQKCGQRLGKSLIWSFSCTLCGSVSSTREGPPCFRFHLLRFISTAKPVSVSIKAAFHRRNIFCKFSLSCAGKYSCGNTARQSMPGGSCSSLWKPVCSNASIEKFYGIAS